MSVITIIATTDTIVVASDSKVTGGRTHEAFPKIREYQENLAFFCMGNASFAYHAFKHIDSMKEACGNISFLEAVEYIDANKANLEASPPFENFRSLFGVCGFNNEKPMAYVTMINPKNTHEFSKIVSPIEKKPSYLALHPPDMDFTQCQILFKSNIPSTENLNPHQMVSACRKTILEMCNHSQMINRRIQYWLYRNSPRIHMTQLIRQIPD